MRFFFPKYSPLVSAQTCAYSKKRFFFLFFPFFSFTYECAITCCLRCADDVFFCKWNLLLFIAPIASVRYVEVTKTVRKKNSSTHLIPRAEEIGLETNTTAKISSKFALESPYTSNIFSPRSSKLQTGLHVSKQSARHSKDLPGNPADLEIQIF